jgi:hypothetical protein
MRRGEVLGANSEHNRVDHIASAARPEGTKTNDVSANLSLGATTSPAPATSVHS